jgi:hypothetical protein
LRRHTRLPFFCASRRRRVPVVPHGANARALSPTTGTARRLAHRVTLEDAERLLALGADRLIIGTGQSGVLHLNQEAQAYFEQHGCEVSLAPTPEAIEHFNAAAEPVTALFHLTC